MSKKNYNDEDTLQPSYDLTKLKVVGRGALRERYGSPANFRRLQQSNPARIVEIAEDLAEFFPDEQAVNEALRFLLRITQASASDLRREQP